MNQISMAIHTFLFVSRPGIQYRPMGQHGSPFIRDVKDISMAFLALVVLEKGVSLLAILFVIIFIQNKEVYKHIFDPVGSFCIEEIKSVMRGGEVTVHTVGHKSLRIICMG